MREIGRIAEQRGVVIESREVQRTAAVRCSPRLQSLLSDAVTRTGVDPHHLPSGAGHDFELDVRKSTQPKSSGKVDFNDRYGKIFL